MPYLSVSDPSTTIVITWVSGDICTWTVATENAVLLESSTVRAFIRDDVCEWTAYAEKLMRYKHTAGTAGSGMAISGDEDHITAANLTQVGSSELYFYPADQDTETNIATVELQLEDQIIS